jgi:hypothetical protein
VVVQVGIDNGISGGLVALMGGDILSWAAMPTTQDRVVHAAAVAAWLGEMKRAGEVRVCLEKVTGARSARAMGSMSDSFATLRTVLELTKVPYTIVAAATWQSCYWPRGEDTKLAAWRVFRSIWPEESLVAPGCRRQHDGCVDAALIAYWAAGKAAKCSY